MGTAATVRVCACGVTAEQAGREGEPVCAKNWPGAHSFVEHEVDDRPKPVACTECGETVYPRREMVSASESEIKPPRVDERGRCAVCVWMGS